MCEPMDEIFNHFWAKEKVVYESETEINQEMQRMNDRLKLHFKSLVMSHVLAWTQIKSDPVQKWVIQADGSRWKCTNICYYMVYDQRMFILLLACHVYTPSLFQRGTGICGSLDLEQMTSNQ